MTRRKILNFCYVPQHAVPPSTDFHLGHIVVVLRRSHALVTSSSPSTRRRAEETLPRPQLDLEFEGRRRAERAQNSEVPYVWCLIGWIAKTFDYINRVKLIVPLSVYEGTWTHPPPLVAKHLLDRSCVSIGFFLKFHATFPNNLSQR